MSETPHAGVGIERLPILAPGHQTGRADAGLAKLHGVATLRQLGLRGNPVTKAGIDALAAALPRCQITWDGPTVEPREK